MKKILVIYYSRSGNTKRIASEISRNLNADISEIVDLKSRKGIIGWIFAGRDGFRRNLTEIKAVSPENYNLVVIGTPVWGANMAPAVRTFLTRNKGKIKNIAFFSTFGGKIGKTFYEMKELSKSPKAVLGIRDKELNSEDNKKRIKEFCVKLK